MPYADPDRQRQAKRESARRRRAALRVPFPDGPLPDPPDRDELLRLLGARARTGNVTAIRLLLIRPWEKPRKSGIKSEPDDVLAELLRRRETNCDHN